MKKRHKKKRGSVFTLLLTNYIVFTLALIIVLSALFFFLIYRTYHQVQRYSDWQMAQYSLALTAKEYGKFPTKRLLGEDGFILVLDEANNPIYNEGPFDVSLSDEELQFIPAFGLIPNVSTRELHLENGGINYEVSIGSGGLGDETEMKLYILDERYRLLYASGEDLTSDLTEKEYQLLAQTYYPGYYVSRYPFMSSDGRPHTLLLFEEGGELNTFGLWFLELWMVGGALFLVVYCLMIAGFIIWLRRKITTPLRLLGENLNQFEVGANAQDTYRGPREFREIFDQFATMAQRLETSEAERRSLEAEKRTMLADITHDLKTPITVIQGYATVLRDGLIPEGEQNQYLTTIKNKADDLNGLIISFYEYNKLEHPDYQLKLEPVDICNYLREYVAGRYNELEAGGFTPEVSIPELHVFCSIDRGQMKRVFDNIVGNAVKHNPKGTVLYFSLTLSEDCIVITLADNGVGIPPEISASIFAPFTMGETSRRGGGSGLGLSIARRIVEMHGGEICLSSDESPYATAFMITLPIP